MNLVMPLSKSCSICGCAVVVCESTQADFQRSKIRVHVNGERWDQREFLCGQIVKWIPNFRREEIVESCRNNEEYKDRQKAITELDTQILTLQRQRINLQTPSVNYSGNPQKDAEPQSIN